MTLLRRIVEWLEWLKGAAPGRLPGASPGERAALATLMLEAGVRPTMAEWSGLALEDQVALAAAGRELWLRRTRTAALACGGDLDALRHTAELDGGEAHDDLMTARVLAGNA